jgi:hypothetical protein
LGKLYANSARSALTSLVWLLKRHPVEREEKRILQGLPLKTPLHRAKLLEQTAQANI